MMAEMTLSAEAELSGLAAATCEQPEKAEGIVVGRCRRCESCRRHDRLMAHLGFMRWLREAHRPEDGCFPAATVGQVLALTEPED